MSQQIILERPYTISFYPKLNSIPRTKRASKAMKMLKEFVMKHMKVDDVWVSADVNEYIFKNGMQKPPRKISIRAAKSDDDVVEIHLAAATPEEIFKKKGVKVTTRLTEDEIDLEEEDFEEDEE